MTEARRQGSIFVAIGVLERSAIVGVLALLLAGVGAVNLSQGRGDLFLLWLAFATYVLVLVLPFLVYRRGMGWFHPLIFVVLWWQLLRRVLPRIGVYANGLGDHRILEHASPDELNFVVTEDLLLAALGLLAFFASFLGDGSWLTPLRLRFRPPRYVVAKVVLVAVASVCALVVLARGVGGFGQLMLLRGLPGEAQENLIDAVGGGVWQFLVGLLKIACLVWLALRPADWRTPQFVLLFGVALAIGFVATGSRSGVVVSVIMAASIWLLHSRRVPYTVVVAGFLFGLLVIGLGAKFREGSRGALVLGDVELQGSVIESIARGIETAVRYRTQADGTYGILARVPEEVGLLYGESYLSIPFAPIPGRILPFDKPEAGGKLNAIRVFGNPSTSIPPGTIGEAYWNFHVVGVLVVMFLFGLLLRWCARVYRANGGEGWSKMFYLFTLFMFQPNSPAFYNWMHLIVPGGLFVLFFCGLPQRMGSRSPVELGDSRGQGAVSEGG